MPNATDVQRFDDALATLNELAAHDMDFYKGYEGVLDWLAQQTSPGTAKGVVGEQLSLGWHFRKSAAITQFREALRAYLLVLITRYGLAGGQLKTAKGIEPGSDAAHTRRVLLASLKNYCRRIVVRHGGIVIDSKVYEWAGLRHFADVARVLRDGRDRGAEILRHAFAYARRVDDAQGHYARWFGIANRREVATDFERLIEVYHKKSIRIRVEERTERDGSVRLDTVYGVATRQHWDYAQPKELIDIRLGDYFFDGTAVHSSQIVHDTAMYDAILERHLVMKKEQATALEDLRQAIMAGGDEVALEAAHTLREADIARRIRENAARVPPQDRTREKISVTGVILHEVTHNAIWTTDVQIEGQAMYGPNCCLWLARNHPGKAATNADNFRLFSEEFLTA
ncbi:MAG TPA: M35 family metallo-endopeptidase [Ramlibacter sp.]|uniref:M35 family metallo-endopeptidase n=1 Tax=Ramlibacter sp. TaxID=1917967 RepID=UPI002CB27C56|nr:M35 family metallo-endopeptidase [Ramlibacter sp.]HVZ44297.1 M35 family metallo-endopeptidase [Ramlibacter sp.]